MSTARRPPSNLCVCRRFPIPVDKAKSAWCGEFKARPPKLPTMEELRLELINEIARLTEAIYPENAFLNRSMTTERVRDIQKCIGVARSYLPNDSGKTVDDFMNAIKRLKTL